MCLMIFLCVLMSGWRYVLSFDPQMEIPLMRCVVEFGHGVGRDEFVGVSEAMDCGLEFFDNGLVVFETVLDS